MGMYCRTISTESPEYEYRLGFRYVSKASCVQHCRRNTAPSSSHRIRRLRQIRSSRQNYVNRPLQTAVDSNPRTVSPGQSNDGPEPQGLTGRDLAAIQVQRAVRGWRARVLAVKMVHDRAWRALLFIQAIWRGALARHRLRQREAQETVFFEEIGDGRKAFVRDTPKQRSKTKKQQARSGLAGVSQQHERCPERATWEQSWGRVCCERPSFRDRVRVWQSIAELKRAGGRGRMGITNNEAYGALRDSLGNASVAGNLLSNEEYLLGRRLQKEKGRRGLDEIPPFLSLAYNVRPGLFFSGKIPSSAGIQHGGRETGVGHGDDDIFEVVSSLFYKVPRTAKK